MIAVTYLGNVPESPAGRVAALYGRLSGRASDTVMRALTDGPDALPTADASAADEFARAMDRLGLLLTDSADSSLDRLTVALDGCPRAVRLFRAFVRATTLEGCLCPFEGKRSAPLDPPDVCEPAPFWAAWVGVLRDRAAALPRRSRWTPFGAHTDDTQYLLAGVRAGFRGGPAAEALLDEWRGDGRRRVWRGIGRRTRGFLASGDPDALAGEHTLGDLLRGAAVAACAAVRGDEPGGVWQEFATAARLTREQRGAVGAFVAAIGAALDGDGKARARCLRELARHYPPVGGRLGLFDLVAGTLGDRPDPRAFAWQLSAVGADYDTYGFLAGFLAADGAVPLSALARPTCDEGVAGPLERALAECSARAVAHCLLAAARVAGAPLAEPDGFDTDTAAAERELNAVLEGCRRGAG